MDAETNRNQSTEPTLQEVVARVRETALRHALLASGDRVLVACSGGPDSVALAALLQRCELNLGLVIGHVDHGLRADSSADAKAVAGLAGSLALPFLQRRLTLAGADGADRQVSEDVARRGRLAALEEMADEAGATCIALGHTADDQLETLLMRLCRGAGLTGLVGIAPRRGRLVRPLLEIGRREVLATLDAVGWAAREDPTNSSRQYFRNRMRRDVVPLLKQENPRLLDAVVRATQGLREELEALAYCEERELERLTAPDPIGHALDATALDALPRGLATRLIRRLWQGVREPGAELGRNHVESALALLDRDTGPRIQLPGGVVAYRQYDQLVLAPASALEDPGDVTLDIPEPDLYELPELGLLLEAGTGRRPATPPPWPLIVRNQRPGDRLLTPSGSRKLSDLLVDRKVPRAHRRRLPLVLLNGEIVWIPGVWHRDEAVPSADVQRATLPSLGVRLLFRGGGSA